MTKDDLKEPVSFIDRYTDFIENSDMKDLENNDITYYSDTLKCDVCISLKEQKYGQETPYALNCSLKKDGEIIGNLPYIRFGISNNNMYLYAIQNMGDRHLNYRALYHLNKDVPKELSTMSQNFVFSMGIVVSLMKYYGIDNLYMPYNSPFKFRLKELSAVPQEYVDNEIKKYMEKGKTLEKATDYVESMFQSLGMRTVNQVKNIEENMTNNFVKCGYRIKYHGSNIDANNEKYLLQLHINHNKNTFNNEILEELYNKLPNKIMEEQYQKKIIFSGLYVCIVFLKK